MSDDVKRLAAVLRDIAVSDDPAGVARDVADDLDPPAESGPDWTDPQTWVDAARDASIWADLPQPSTVVEYRAAYRAWADTPEGAATQARLANTLLTVSRFSR